MRWRESKVRRCIDGELATNMESRLPLCIFSTLEVSLFVVKRCHYEYTSENYIKFCIVLY